MIAEQVLKRIEVLHENNYLNRDIKPDNLAVGLAKR
jgi:serine/threonine protein kinase